MRHPRRCLRDPAVLTTALTARTVLLTAVMLVLWSALPGVFGWHVTTVASDSMSPRIRSGDVIGAVPVDPATLETGHVVLAVDPDQAERLRLHRIDSIQPDGRLRLRGDANPTADQTPVEPRAVLGRALIRTPAIGLPSMWVRDGAWTLLLTTVIGIAALIVLGRSDRSIRRGEPCSRCHTPRWSSAWTLPQPERSLGARCLAAVAVIIALSATFASATWSANTTAAAGLRTDDAFPCFSPLLDAPLIAWDFAEKSGTTIRDTTGHGYDGVFSARIGRVDGSCASNPHTTSTGTPAGVHGTKSTTSPTAFSAEAWFRTTESHGRVVGFGNRAGGGSTNFSRNLYVTTDGRLAFGVTAATVTTSAVRVDDGEWHHAVGTSTGTAQQLWLDGVIVGSAPITPSAAYTGYWRAGYDNLAAWPGATTTSHYFAGELDTVRIYDRALSGDAVARHHAAGR